MAVSLSGFIGEVGYEDAGTLSPLYGVSAHLYRTQERGVPQLFRVEGYPIPAAGNVVASRRALLHALGAGSEAEAYARLLGALREAGRPAGVEGTPGGLRRLPGLLGDVPAVKFYEGEGGPYITSSVFIACLGGVCNASIHRVMVLGRDAAVARLVPRHLWHLYREARRRGEELPVSIVVGVHPAVLLAAATSPPLGVFELEAARRLVPGLRVVESPIHGNPVPYPFSVLVEARLTGEMVEEGPFVDATGTLDVVRRQPLIRVEAVYHVDGEPFHIILPAGREHANLMGFPREAQIWEAVSRVVPRVVAVRLTPASGGWLHAVVAIEKSVDGDAKNAILAALAAHPSLKHVVVVDGDIDVDDPAQVEWAIATRFQASRDLVVVAEARGSSLDPSAEGGLTSKVGIDATAPLDERDKFRRARIPGV
jgi:UbiD family decarboxylase